MNDQQKRDSLQRVLRQMSQQRSQCALFPATAHAEADSLLVMALSILGEGTEMMPAINGIIDNYMAIRQWYLPKETRG